MAASNRLAGQSGTIGSFDSVVDPSLYQTHWTAREKISESSDVTVLEMLYQISRDFAMAPGASKHWVSQQLMLLKKNFLSHKDDFPETFEQLVEILDPFLPPMHTFDVCVNDCIIFRKENEFDVNCPVCGEARFKEDGKTPRRRFTYVPLTPQIREMVASKEINELINKHKYTDRPEKHQYDLHDSNIWTEDWFGTDGAFSGIDNGIVLSICLDGVNPFAQEKIDYSMWPIILQVDNLPPKLRKTCAGMLVLGIIPSNGSKEPKNLEPYLKLLVEELQDLEKCKMFDHMGNEVSVSVRLYRYILDFPAIGKVLHYPGSARAYRACPLCRLVWENCKCNKTIFLQNRRYLPTDHTLRLQKQGHVNNAEETRGTPPGPYNYEKIQELRKKYERLPNNNQKDKFCKEHGVKEVYSFMDLSYHRGHEQIGYDIMHTLKNACSNISKILNGFVSLDKINEVEQEKRLREYEPYQGLTKEEVSEVDRKIKTLIFPATSTGCKKSFLTEAGKVGPTHAWHEYAAKNVMLYVIRDIKSEKMRRSLMYWLSINNRIEQYEIDPAENDRLSRDQHLSAALMERDFPLVYNSICSHALHHEVEKREVYGPVHSRSMWCFERLNSVISRRVKSRKDPEASATRTLRLLHWVTNVIIGKRLPLTKRNTESELDKILLNLPIEEQNSRKRRRETTLTATQQQHLSQALGKPCVETKVNVIQWYKKLNEIDDTGVIRYQSGTTKPNNFQKSSRFVYVSTEKRYGEISTIFEHCQSCTDNKTWFEVNLYLDAGIDAETMLTFAKKDGLRQVCVVSAKDLSNPLIVSIDGDTVWFISVKHSSDFGWLNRHVNNYD